MPLIIQGNTLAKNKVLLTKKNKVNVGSKIPIYIFEEHQEGSYCYFIIRYCTVPTVQIVNII